MKTILFIEVKVRDREGKIISQFRRRSKSFVKQWNELVHQHMSQTTVDIVDTGGTTRTVASDINDFDMSSPAGNVTYGIVFGTDDTPVTINDYALGALIAEGSGVGQLNHILTTVNASSVSAPNCDFILYRAGVNNSGTTITVKESGIYVYFGNSYRCMVIRDVFAVAQDVPDGGSISVNYTLRVTV